MFGSLWFQYRKLVVISLFLVAGAVWHGAVEAASLSLSWTDNSNDEDGFKIERLIAGLVDTTMTVSANVTSYVDSGLVAGTIYCYRVRAFNAAGDSDVSNQACASAQTAVVSASVASVSLSVSPTTVTAGSTVSASWSGISSPSSTDWIGLYTPGAPNSALIDWIYVSCSKTPGSARASSSCPFVLPSSLAPGTHELRLLANNGDTLLATSSALTAQTATMSILSSSQTTNGGSNSSSGSGATSSISSMVSSSSSQQVAPVDIGVFRDGMWFILQLLDGGVTAVDWGGATNDVLVPADYDGDGKIDPAVYRDGIWYILQSSDGVLTSVGLGAASGDVPVPADYDGDGKVDEAVYRNGLWFILRSSDGVLTSVGLGGESTDVPLN